MERNIFNELYDKLDAVHGSMSETYCLVQSYRQELLFALLVAANSKSAKIPLDSTPSGMI